MKILIGSVISILPFSPGIAWDWIQYAAGFRKLGHEVYYLEEVQPGWCVDESGRPCSFAQSANRRLFREIMERFGLRERACQIYAGGELIDGMSRSALMTLVKEADLLLNISGHIRTDLILENARRRVYFDQDPVYTQLWHAAYGKELNFGEHEVFCSVGLNIGTPHTPIPDCGIRWHPVLPPVAPEYWPGDGGAPGGRFTTIASWGGFGDLQYRGEWYRSKYEEFVRFAELPRKVDAELEVALRRHREEDPRIQKLRASGWQITDAGRISDLSTYQDYIRASRAEIGIAKHAYVQGCSGWFSDRSTHYLASGRPVLHQSTGFERHLPTGQGLLSFRTMEEAVAGVESICRDYAAHCRAARDLAEEHLSYRKVLPELLEACLA